MIEFAPGGIASGGFLFFTGFLMGNRCDIMGSYGKAGCGKWDREIRMEEL